MIHMRLTKKDHGLPFFGYLYPVRRKMQAVPLEMGDCSDFSKKFHRQQYLKKA